MCSYLQCQTYVNSFLHALAIKTVITNNLLYALHYGMSSTGMPPLNYMALGFSRIEICHSNTGQQFSKYTLPGLPLAYAEPGILRALSFLQ